MSEALQRSTEYYGLGQSGYTAGRTEGDHALELQLEERNLTSPRHLDPAYVDPSAVEPLSADLGDDERFTGSGGVPWAPDAMSVAHERGADHANEVSHASVSRST
jgi:hypothetical protein